MSLLEHPEAQALLGDATVSPETVRDCTDRLTGFLHRYLPKFYRAERRENATTVIRGLLTNEEARRDKCHVPPEVKFQETWRIAPDLLDRSPPGLPHGWIVGDDELGRASEFRAALRRRSERYVPDVPCDPTVRDLERRRPPRKKAGVGRRREVPSRRADIWAAGQPGSRWERITVGDGERGRWRSMR
jgi:hypothetical protein